MWIRRLCCGLASPILLMAHACWARIAHRREINDHIPGGHNAPSPGGRAC